MQPPSGQFDTPPLTGPTVPAGEAHAASLWSQRALLRWLTALAIALLLGATAAFLWTGRQRALDDASAQAVRRVAGLAQDLEQSLALARLSIEQAEARLASLPPGAPLSTLQTEAAADRSALLSALPLPFELHVLDRQGHVLDVAAPARRAGSPERAPHQFMSGNLSPGRWHVGVPEGPPNARVIPLVWAAAPNPHGVTGYNADLSFSALLARLERDRVPDSGGSALVRIEADGSATVLARAPFAEQALGQPLRTPWVRAMATSPQGVVETLSPLDGIRRQTAYQRLGAEAGSMAIAYGVSIDATLAAWNAQLPFVVLTALLLAGGMGYGGWRLDRSLGALAESEKRFRLAAASGHVWDWDLETGVVRFPSAAWRTMGYAAPLQGETARLFASHLHTKDVSTLRANLVRHLRDREPFSATFRMLDAQGQLHWFETQGQATWNAGGRATYMAGTAFEITERQALEESQRQIQHRLDTVANAASALFWTSDLSMRTDWVNRRWLEFTGRSQAEELGMNWTSSMHPDDRERCGAAYAAAFEAREPFALEYRRRHHDGGYRWVLDQGRPRHDADGRFIGFIGSCVELTGLKAAEQAAAHQQQLLDRVFDVLPDLFFLIDPDGTIREYKASSLGDLHVPPGQFLGRRMQDVLPPDPAAQFEQKLDLARQGELVTYRYSLQVPQGLKTYEARLARLPDAAQLMAIVRDVTDQSMLEQERERLSQFVVLLFRLASSFINLPLPHIDREINRALGEMGRFVGADRAYLFKYDFEAHTSSNTHEWCAEGIPPQIQNQQDLSLDASPALVDIHRRGELFHVSNVADLPEGWLKDFLLHQGIRSVILLPLMGSSDCLGFVGFDSVREQHDHDQEEQGLLRLFASMLVNVYERQRADTQVRQLTADLERRVRERTQQLDASVQRLSQINAELETFTYSVSHDLKSPLRSLEGFCTLLLEEHAQQLDAEARDYLGRIQRAARHMALLINDLLAYARLEPQQDLSSVSLVALTASVLDGLRNELDACGTRLQLSIPEGLSVQASPQGLAMVLRNLIDNALKFSQPGLPPVIRISACVQGPWVRLTVADNGQGFDMQYHDRIFALFQRLHRADQVPGTGIGLAMVHKAVQRMGGRIRAESTPGQGASFHIELLQA